MTLTLENKLMMDNLIMYSEELMEEPEVPFGSLDQEVADDVPVMLSEGEYVIPADVVRYWGLKHLEEMRSMAKCGLMSMEMDGRLHKVDDDGLLPAEEEKEEDAEVATEDAIEIVSMDFDIDEMQEDMEEEEEEEEEDVDFDGNEEDLVFEVRSLSSSPDKDRMIHADAGGDIDRDRQDNFGMTPTSPASLAVNPVDIMNAMVDVGLIGAEATTLGTAASVVSNALENATTKDIRGIASSVVSDQFANATPAVPGALSTAAQVAEKISGPPLGIPGLSNVMSPSVQTFSDINGAVTTAIGFGAARAAAKSSMTDLVAIGLEIQRGTKPADDLFSFDGQLVGITTGNIAGVPTQAVVGVVDPQFGVADYDKGVAAAYGVDLRSAPTNEKTGRPEFGKAEALAGVERGPGGFAVSGGYSLSKGDFTDVNGNVSALGTISSMNNLNERQFGIMDRAKGTGFLGFTDKDRDRRNAEFFANRDVQAQAQFDKDEMNKELSRIGVDLTDYTSPTNDETLDATLDDLTDIMSIEDLNPDTTFDDLDATLEPPADYSFPEPAPTPTEVLSYNTTDLPDYVDPPTTNDLTELDLADTTFGRSPPDPTEVRGLMSLDIQDMLGAIGVDDPSADAQAGVDADVDPGVESDENEDENETPD